MRPVKRTGPTNVLLRRTIRLLRSAARKYDAPVWRRVAELLERPARLRYVVNLSKIERYARPGEVVVVPGKVLGAGVLKRSIVVAAVGFSASALRKIRESGGRAIHILQLVEENPEGRGVRIIV